MKGLVGLAAVDRRRRSSERVFWCFPAMSLFNPMSLFNQHFNCPVVRTALRLEFAKVIARVTAENFVLGLYDRPSRKALAALAADVGDPETRRFLAGLFRHPGGAVRMLAVSSLSDLAADPEFLSLYLECATDQDAAIADAALAALAPFCERPAVASLVVQRFSSTIPSPETMIAFKPYLADAIEVRRAILKRIPNHSERHVVGVARCCFECLAPYVADPEVLAVFMAGLRHPAPAARAAAVVGLAPLVHRSEVRAALLPLLRDVFPEVRAAAANVLAACVDEPAVATELLRLTNDHSPSVRVTAIKSLAPRVGDPKVRATLFPLCFINYDQATRLAAVSVLASFLAGAEEGDCGSPTRDDVERMLLEQLTRSPESCRAALRGLAPELSESAVQTLWARFSCWPAAANKKDEEHDLKKRRLYLDAFRMLQGGGKVEAIIAGTIYRSLGLLRFLTDDENLLSFSRHCPRFFGLRRRDDVFFAPPPALSPDATDGARPVSPSFSAP